MVNMFKLSTFSMKVTVVSVFIALSSLIVIVALSLQYYFSLSLAKNAAADSFHRTANNFSEKIDSLNIQTSNLVNILSHYPEVDQHISKEVLHPATEVISQAMLKNPSLYGVYIGYANGDMYQLINLSISDTLREGHDAEANDSWLVVRVYETSSGRDRVSLYFDDKFNLNHQKVVPSNYFANKRPWYREAMNDSNVIKTTPYVFHHLQSPGVTYAKRIQNTQTVIAADISLSSLSTFLTKNNPGGESMLFDADGRVHAHSFELHDNRVTTSVDPEELMVEDPQYPNSLGVVPLRQFVEMAKQSEIQGSTIQTVDAQGRKLMLYVQRVEADLGKKEYVGFIIPAKQVQAPYMEKVNQSTLITFSAMLLLVPVLLFFANIIVHPVRLLFAESEKIKKREFTKVQKVPSRIAELSALSDSIYSMSCSIEQYQKNQQELMDSFVKLIAQAIDDKSPYTAGHCERVPILAIDLAKIASNSDLPAFDNFNLKTEEEWREFEIAAWLHDCGKVTTPEHIVDKGSKLEAICNRIHLIRMRFEVLLRDAEIEYWQGISSGQDANVLKSTLVQRQAQIKDDFEFVAQCNVGGEFMSEEHVERVKRIATQTWLRHLDDRLGLSPEEERRMEKFAAVRLPCVENLLSDKAEHLIEWPQDPNTKNSEDIKLKAPKYQANLGEIYNLTIEKGTLTLEDRYRINEHIVSTIRMLEALPLPEELKRVPEYAGGHHETLTGNGYPKQLGANELPTATRILAIADVFEALTASDRPYKKAKPLSEAIKILSFMVEDGHLDKDLFKLMLSHELHLQYAETYLAQDQIDEVDIEKYITS
ncbi:hypothetical protein ONE56_17710 [Vibrio mytili]|uniref:HD domain-containing phosphohydrolase n=1 Tax=Vibrio mytili TaxID=50718 RepID=UPI003C703471